MIVVADQSNLQHPRLDGSIADLASKEISLIDARSACVGSQFSSGPPWLILLHLSCACHQGRSLPVSALAILTELSADIVRRWVFILNDYGLVHYFADFDGTGLTSNGATRIAKCLCQDRQNLSRPNIIGRLWRRIRFSGPSRETVLVGIPCCLFMAVYFFQPLAGLIGAVLPGG